MYYFPQDKLPVLTSLATNFAVFNRWFASIPGPTICNRAFAHYGTSFGQVGMNVFYPQGKSIYERLEDAGHTAKLYYFDQASSTMEVVNLLQHQPQLFGTYDQFLADCKSGKLSDYSFIEPNYTDHDNEDGAQLACDQHPDHNIQAGEIYIASVYNAIRSNPVLWASTALLVVYDEHGGIFDHVPPPACTPDGHSAGPADTGLNFTFNFDRLGVRVPAILISPWVPKGTVVGSDRVFEHASIPATVTKKFIGNYTASTAREQNAQTFLDLLSLDAPRTDYLSFNL
jgi:phospholipase C